MKPLKAFRRFERVLSAEAGKRRQGRPGRPATGVTKGRSSISLDFRLLKMAKKAAFSEGMSFSAWIERCVEETLSPNGKGGAR